MWWGGYTFGPRHLVPIIPFLIIPILFVPKNWWKFIYPLIVISIVLMWMGTSVDPQMIPDKHPNPLYGYAFSQFVKGQFSPNLGISLGAGFYGGIYLFGLIILICSVGLMRKLKRMEKNE